MDLSRVEDILKYFLGEAETLPHPLSRIEELLIALGRLIEEGKVSNPISIRGRVSSVSELPVDATPGWMYFVGPSDAETYSEYIYLDSGRWEYLGSSMIDIDTTLNPSSTNPVQNGAIATAINQINQTLNLKVDKVQGKGLSTEDYTTAEKTKLSGIEAGAEINVQPDWNQNDNTSDDYIKNKPTLGTAAAKNTDATPTSGSSNLVESGGVYTALGGKVDKETGKGLSTEDYTTAEKTKVSKTITIWQGTQAAYDALLTKEYDEYHVIEAVSE